MTLESFANGNGPTGGNSGGPVIPMVDDGDPLSDPTHWWRLI